MSTHMSVCRQAKAAAALRNLATLEDNLPRIVDSGAIEALVELVWLGDADAKANAAAALWCLASVHTSVHISIHMSLQARYLVPRGI